jgi:hypothetical protein
VKVWLVDVAVDDDGVADDVADKDVAEVLDVVDEAVVDVTALPFNPISTSSISMPGSAVVSEGT